MVLDAVSNVEQFVDIFLGIYTIAILLFVLSSWLPRPYGLGPLLRFLYDVCDPYLRIWRRFVPAFGPIDLSPFLALIGIGAVRVVLISLLNQLH